MVFTVAPIKFEGLITNFAERISVVDARILADLARLRGLEALQHNVSMGGLSRKDSGTVFARLGAATGRIALAARECDATERFLLVSDRQI